jgi:hypothetical protein
MRTEHDDFIGFVRTRNLSDDVEQGRIGIISVFDVGLDHHGDVLGQDAGDAAILLGWDRDCQGCLCRIGRAIPPYSVKAVAARGRCQCPESAFRPEKLIANSGLPESSAPAGGLLRGLSLRRSAGPLARLSRLLSLSGRLARGRSPEALAGRSDSELKSGRRLELQLGQFIDRVPF